MCVCNHTINDGQQCVNVTDGENQDAEDAGDVKVCCMCSTFGA
jgi:hypothetical protein